MSSSAVLPAICSGCPRLACVLCAVVLGAPSVALAEVTEPNGVAVPLDTANGEMQLSELFASRGEMLDFVADGSSMPDTFSPLCGFTATLVLKQSGSSLGVGWYNVDPARTAPPDPSEIHPVVAAGSPVGTAVTGADIRNDPSYRGGAISFALLRDPPYFSEARWNPDCALCAAPGPWVLSVAYPSRVSSHAFYVAFEDGDANAFGWSNDGDFNDYVFYFEGLSCAGAGESCEVPGALGVCVPGVLECDVGGALACKPSIAPSEEQCNALDDDCDGASDEGDALCEAGAVCSRGRCVPRCGTLEFPCTSAPFTLCEDGLCIEPACAGKRCGEGEACLGGACRAPCDGVVCPRGRQCRLGACVDPCAGVTCSDERACSDGACLLRCACSGCAAGLACDSDSGLCVQPGCEHAGCKAGEVCVAGACQDACEGAVCPQGSSCERGECVAAPPAEASEPIDAGTRAAPMTASGNGPHSLDSANAGASGAAAGGAGASGAPTSQPPSAMMRVTSATQAKGCACEVPRAGSTRRDRYGLGELIAAALVLIFGLRLRRRVTVTR